MNSKFEKFEFLFPKRVYRCPCFQAAIEQCFNNEDYSIADISCYLKDIDSKNVLSTRIFSTRVGENKEHCLFTCEQHLKTVLLAAEKNVCTSPENDDTVSFEYSYKKEVYCKGCLKQYMRLLYSYFYFVEF